MSVCHRCNKPHEGGGRKWCDACKVVVTREQRNAQMRRYYSGDVGKARLRARKKDPKHEHNYRARRLERAAKADDGTVTTKVLRAEYARTHCPYCASPMQAKDKQLDHMQPLSLGGMHSACNVLVCCATCNTTKRNSPLTEWLSTLRPEQAAQCRALWIKRNGAPPEQQGLMLVDLGVVTRKAASLRERITREAVAEANRARAAWFKRDAPDEWVTAYWEGMGQPWRNTRLTDGQQYKARYDNDEDFRRREIARQHAYKSRNRTPCKGKRIVIGRRFGKGGSISVA